MKLKTTISSTELLVYEINAIIGLTMNLHYKSVTTKECP